MAKSTSVPQTLMPIVTVDSVDAIRSFYVDELGFDHMMGVVGKDGENVRITDPRTTQWWNDRTFKVVDPYGYVIWFYETTSERKPPEGEKIV